MGKFEEVYAININDKTEKKGNLTYLSWAFAWAEFKKVYPDATYDVNEFDGNFCTGNDKMGYMVQTHVTAGEQTYEMWLPVMDMRNNAILQPKTTEINKAIMRCLTKNLAMFGLGLYIYAGEDLPESDESDSSESDVAKKKIKPIIEPKTSDKKKPFEPLTKSEMVEKYGVSVPEKTAVWLEGKFGKEMSNFTEEETAWARAELEKKKKEKEAAAREKLSKLGDEDIPFPMGD